jgi:hypothetical protein
VIWPRCSEIRVIRDTSARHSWLAVLKRLVKHLRQAWPDTLIVCRGDSHFASPEVMEWIEPQAHFRYVTGLTGNAVLKNLAHAVGEQAKRAYSLHFADPLEACTERLAAQEEAGINMHSVRVRPAMPRLRESYTPN